MLHKPHCQSPPSARHGVHAVAPDRALTTRARNGPRWTSMTSPTSGGQARRVNFSLPLLRAFSVDWRPRWRRGRGHDDTRARPYPDPRTNRADGRRPDRRDRTSPPTSPPLAPLLHPRRARKEDGPEWRKRNFNPRCLLAKGGFPWRNGNRHRSGNRQQEPCPILGGRAFESQSWRRVGARLRLCLG